MHLATRLTIASAGRGSGESSGDSLLNCLDVGVLEVFGGSTGGAGVGLGAGRGFGKHTSDGSDVSEAETVGVGTGPCLGSSLSDRFGESQCEGVSVGDGPTTSEAQPIAVDLHCSVGPHLRHSGRDGRHS
ncbi:hypothetical protein, partial [Pyruvatibacter sp.]